MAQTNTERKKKVKVLYNTQKQLNSNIFIQLFELYA